MELNAYQKKATKTGDALVIGELMDFYEYQTRALSTAKMGSKKWYYALGLAGEAGEVVEKVKKFYRDDHGEFTTERIESIKKEMGDVLWYLAVLADTFAISLEEVAQHNLDKLAEREAQGRIHGDGDNR